MVTKEIQDIFPHTCIGYNCAICWWVDGRMQEQTVRKHHILARLNRLAPEGKPEAEAPRG